MLNTHHRRNSLPVRNFLETQNEDKQYEPGSSALNPVILFLNSNT